MNKSKNIIRINELEKHLLSCIEKNCIIRQKEKEEWKIIDNNWEFIK